MYTKGKNMGGRNWEIGVDIYTLLIKCVKQITNKTYCTAQGTLPSALG